MERIARQWLAILKFIYICLPALTAVSASALQSFYLFVSQLWAACRLQSFTLVSQLWTAVSAFALQSFVSQLWTSQALVAECSDFEKHLPFGSTVVYFVRLLCGDHYSGKKNRMKYTIIHAGGLSDEPGGQAPAPWWSGSRWVEEDETKAKAKA